MSWLFTSVYACLLVNGNRASSLAVIFDINTCMHIMTAGIKVLSIGFQFQREDLSNCKG